jgi:class 3 adenylate cyclase
MRCPSCGSEIQPARFCPECGERLEAATDPTRRFVTALFCDLVGSTELAERTDPEVLRATVDAYFSAMRTAIERHGGVVEKFIGDAVVGVFGIPTTHEDDVVRAARAALEMRGAAGELAVDGEALRVRIAIDAGEVFADVVAAREGRIAGDVFNTAARLQSAGSPGDVLVSERAERLARGALETEPLEPLSLKGKAEPVGASRIVGLRASGRRTDSPFVGRDRSLAMLEHALADAVESEACVLVTVLAPAGVGKSRLADAFSDAVEDRATVFVAQTPAYGDGVTFAPLVDLLGAVAGAPTSDGASIARALDERLTATPDGSTVAARLAQVLGVGQPSASDAAWAVRRLLESLAAERPVLVVLEDAHWAEPPMLDLMDSVVQRFRGPAVVLCLARPELLEQRTTWAAGMPRSLTITLPPLSADDARRLAELELVGAPASIVERVCETAEGNPLFLGQVAAMLRDRGAIVDGRWAGGADVDVEIPTTVQALLASRLDRLAPNERLVAERASVEGRRFRPAVTRDLAELSWDEVTVALDALEAKGLARPEDAGGERWRFEHGLVVEAAYRAISKRARADLHERLAQVILDRDRDQPDADESAARHLERALRLREELGDGTVEPLATRAGELFADAGERAFAALDLPTARDLLGRAASLLPRSSSRRLDILPNLGVALSETGRPEETEALLAAAIEEARSAGSERDELRAQVQLLSNYVYRSPNESELRSAVEPAIHAARRLEELGDEVGLAEAAIAVEYLGWMLGDAELQHEWSTRGLEHAIAAGRQREAAQGAADLVLSAAFGPTPLDRCPRIADEIEALGPGPITESAALALRAVANLAVGDEGAFAETERRWHDLLERAGLPWLEAAYALTIAGIENWTGAHERAARRLRLARETVTASGDIWWYGTIDGLLCCALAAQGDRHAFLAIADPFVNSNVVPDPDTLSRREMARSHALLLRGQVPDAEAAARRALEITQRGTLPLAQADAEITIARALDARGLEPEAQLARSRAVALLDAKRHVAGVALLRARTLPNG